MQQQPNLGRTTGLSSDFVDSSSRIQHQQHARHLRFVGGQPSSIPRYPPNFSPTCQHRRCHQDLRSSGSSTSSPKVHRSPKVGARLAASGATGRTLHQHKNILDRIWDSFRVAASSKTGNSASGSARRKSESSRRTSPSLARHGRDSKSIVLANRAFSPLSSRASSSNSSSPGSRTSHPILLQTGGSNNNNRLVGGSSSSYKSTNQQHSVTKKDQKSHNTGSDSMSTRNKTRSNAYPYPRNHSTVILFPGIRPPPEPEPERRTVFVRPPLNRAIPTIPESLSNESIKTQASVSKSDSKQSFVQDTNNTPTIPEHSVVQINGNKTNNNNTTDQNGNTADGSLVIENRLAAHSGVPRQHLKSKSHEIWARRNSSENVINNNNNPPINEHPTQQQQQQQQQYPVSVAAPPHIPSQTIPPSAVPSLRPTTGASTIDQLQFSAVSPAPPSRPISQSSRDSSTIVADSSRSGDSSTTVTPTRTPRSPFTAVSNRLMSRFNTGRFNRADSESLKSREGSTQSLLRLDIWRQRSSSHDFNSNLSSVRSSSGKMQKSSSLEETGGGGGGGGGKTSSSNNAKTTSSTSIFARFRAHRSQMGTPKKQTKQNQNQAGTEPGASAGHVPASQLRAPQKTATGLFRRHHKDPLPKTEKVPVPKKPVSSSAGGSGGPHKSLFAKALSAATREKAAKIPPKQPNPYQPPDARISLLIQQKSGLKETRPMGRDPPSPYLRPPARTPYNGVAPLAESESSTVENSPMVEFPPSEFPLQQNDVPTAVATNNVHRLSLNSTGTDGGGEQTSGVERRTSQASIHSRPSPQLKKRKVTPKSPLTSGALKAAYTDVDADTGVESNTNKDTKPDQQQELLAYSGSPKIQPHHMHVLQRVQHTVAQSNVIEYSAMEKCTLVTKVEPRQQQRQQNEKGPGLKPATGARLVPSGSLESAADESCSSELNDVVAPMHADVSFAHKKNVRLQRMSMASSVSVESGDLMCDYQSSIDDSGTQDDPASAPRSASSTLPRQTATQTQRAGGPIRTSSHRDSIELAVEQLEASMRTLGHQHDPSHQSTSSRAPPDGHEMSVMSSHQRIETRQPQSTMMALKSPVGVLRPPTAYKLDESGGTIDYMLVDAHVYQSMCSDVLALKTLLHQLKATLHNSETTNPFDSAIQQLLSPAGTPGTPTTVQTNLPNGQVRVHSNGQPAVEEQHLDHVSETLRAENDELKRLLAEKENEIERLKKTRAVATVRPQQQQASMIPTNTNGQAPKSALIKPKSLNLTSPSQKQNSMDT